MSVAAVIGIGAQAPQGGAQGQQGGAQTPQGGAPAAGRGGAGGGRGAQNCPAPSIPAAESCISSQLGQANWADPPLPDGPIMIQSALNQHRDLQVFILKGFNQPWSMAWLPDGTMLVTERGGRLRVVRNWVLDPTPVAGVPQVQAGGLQGLMDVVIHPRFAENRYVYLSYHKPVAVMGPTGSRPLEEAAHRRWRAPRRSHAAPGTAPHWST
jgi:glucose/arabinose dehydrogenase